MKKRLFILALAIVSLQAHGQEVDWDRYEVGIDMLWLLGKNNAPVSMFVKKIELKPRKKGAGFVRRGYRMRIGGSFYRPNQRSHIPGNTHTIIESSRFIVRPGYEWQRRIRSIDLFYGIDLHVDGFRQKWTNTYFSFLMSSGEVVYVAYHNDTWDLTLGASPIAGISFHIYKNISLTLESSVLIAYSRERSHYYGNSYYDDIRIQGNGIRLEIDPLYTLNASFRF